MAIQRVRGIVLRANPSRDADLILHILSPKRGKLSVVAKHARRNKRQFGTTLEVLDCGRFELKQSKGNLLSLYTYSPETNFKEIRDSLDKITAASFLCELYDTFSFEGIQEHASEMYEFLYLALRSLTEEDKIETILRSTFLCAAQLMMLAGYLDKDQVGAPSANNFLRLLSHIKTHAEQRIFTESEIKRLIERVKKKHKACSHAKPNRADL